jgi:hypothetical protein
VVSSSTIWVLAVNSRKQVPPNVGDGTIESVCAQLRLLVRRLLRRYKHPPDLEVAAIEPVMKQEEALEENWTKE